MRVDKIKVSNLLDIFLYLKSLHDTGDIPNPMDQLPIYNSCKITLEIGDINPIEVIGIKNISSSFKVLCEEEKSSLDDVKKKV